MNERIRELAEQSGYGARWTNTEQFEQFMEKFAEVIVRECICQCDDENSQKYIMDHFGMKLSDWS